MAMSSTIRPLESAIQSRLIRLLEQHWNSGVCQDH